MFKYFYPTHLESAYYLEAYQKLGSLLDHKNLQQDIKDLKNEVFNINGKAEKMSRMFYYITRTGSKNDSQDLEHQAIIVQALIENKILNLQYNDKSYKVLPLCISQYRDSLYLIGYKNKKDVNNIRTFKFKRISDADITMESFEYPKAKDWNPKEFYDSSSGIITGDSQKCTIRVYGNSKKQISEKVFFNSTLSKSTNEYDEYVINYTNSDELLGQIFVYAQDIEIVDCDITRQKFLDKAKEAIFRNRFDDVA
ncbi:MAG: WYL domain-containing protein [Bacteriovoracaceae bacterium]|jgi:predicted DNA-binding transcriptional regulator YafY|nr:WYL domain-containing protein [Bacteriovoracaceae bacterium]